MAVLEIFTVPAGKPLDVAYLANVIDRFVNLLLAGRGDLEASRTTAETHPVSGSLDVDDVNGPVTITGSPRGDDESDRCLKGASGLYVYVSHSPISFNTVHE